MTWQLIERINDLGTWIYVDEARGYVRGTVESAGRLGYYARVWPSTYGPDMKAIGYFTSESAAKQAVEEVVEWF